MRRVIKRFVQHLETEKNPRPVFSPTPEPEKGFHIISIL